MARDDPEPWQHAKRFGRNLAHLRRASGLTQVQLASLCELHRSEVSLLERGGREPRLGTIVKLAGALAVDLDALLRESSGLPHIDRQQFR